MKKPSVTTLTLSPGQVWTAEGRFAVDALKIAVSWRLSPTEEREPIFVSLLEVHELNIVGRRHTNDTRFSLRRSVDQFLNDGITFLHEGELYTVRPPAIRISQRFRIRAFVLDDPKLGPFSGETFQPNE